MNAREKGFLLLTSALGNPERRTLTPPQLRQLTLRMREMTPPTHERELAVRDLKALGYADGMAEHILALLSEEELLEHYLHKGKRAGCICITRASEAYPVRLRRQLGAEAPGCLWIKGDAELLKTRAVALVGSRDLNAKNAEFASMVGTCAARQGYTLVSGNARGADQTAQQSALAAGGNVISIVADALSEHTPREGVLYVSEDGFDEPFSAQRALSRNRCIHALGEKTFVAQSALRRGGTWDGSVKNLRGRWSELYVFQDGSEATRVLAQMGAQTVETAELAHFSQLRRADACLFDEADRAFF